jgi:hypothetical protein
VLCALSLEEPDKIPLYDLISHFGILSHYAGRKVTTDNAEELLPSAVSRVLDTTRAWFPRPLGRRTDERGFVYERKEPFNEWMIDRPFHSREELIAFVRAEIERLESWSVPDSAAREKLFETKTELKQRFEGTVLPAATAGVALPDAFIPLGMDTFVYLEADEPALVRRWLEAIHGQTMARIGTESGFGRISPLAWIFADVAFKGKLIFSPEYLHSHSLFRNIADICDVYHSYGWKVIFHSDGYIRPIVPDLLDAGVDALAPVEIMAGMDLAELKETFGRRVAFVGGIDLKRIRFGTPEEVRRLTLDAMHIMGPGGGFILGSDAEELDSGLPTENVLAMHETAIDRGRYPLGEYFSR